jgi:hypothetical protein
MRLKLHNNLDTFIMIWYNEGVLEFTERITADITNISKLKKLCREGKYIHYAQ